MVDRDEAVALFERRRDAWLAEDVDGYLALFAPELRLRTPTVDVSGIDEYAALVRSSVANVAPLSFDFHHIAVEGDTVLAEWTIAMRVRRDGRRITYRGMSACALRDGLIETWQEFYDPADLRPA